MRFAHLMDLDDTPVTDLLVPPDVPVRHEIIESPLDTTTALDDLTPLAIKRLREMLEHGLEWDSPRSLQILLSAAQTVLGTQVKVDESRLRKRKTDILPKLLEMLAAEEKRLLAVKMIEHEVLDVG